ncbi:MAG: hypothetical protein ORN98_08775, partial [Alphaproteobacteria bacterium]|nr:hypothetical protein [Alphaproteobacteria bacterium]
GGESLSPAMRSSVGGIELLRFFEQIARKNLAILGGVGLGFERKKTTGRRVMTKKRNANPL